MTEPVVSEKRFAVGFPEFWPEVEKAYPRFFEVAWKLSLALHSVVDRAYSSPEPYQKAILNLSMLAGVTMTEVITLAGNGLGQGAMKCLRTLLETSINTEYLRLWPGEFDNYKEWYWVERFKELEYLREHIPTIIPQLNPDIIRETEQNMVRVRAQFERNKYGGGKELRSSWCSRNLADRSVMTGHQETYRLVNSISSSFIHSTMYGLMRHFDAGSDISRIGIPPMLNWTRQALSAAQYCMVRVVDTVGQTFGVQPDPSAEQLLKDYEFTWSETATK